MKKPPNDMLLLRLNASIRRLTQSLDRCADTIQLLNANTKELSDQSATETPPLNHNDQPIILYDADGNLDIIKFPRGDE